MKKYLLFLGLVISINSIAQTLITGRVSDENGILPLAHVTIKGANSGISTNENGWFEIKAKPGDTLLVSHLGYQSKDHVVGKKTSSEIYLDSYEALDEVLVLGYTNNRTSICSITCISTGCGVCGRLISTITDKEENFPKINFYPNPSKNGIFKIDAVQKLKDVKIVVADISGRIVHEELRKSLKSRIVLNLYQQPSGLYIINLHQRGKRIMSKKAIIL